MGDVNEPTPDVLDELLGSAVGDGMSAGGRNRQLAAIHDALDRRLRWRHRLVTASVTSGIVLAPAGLAVAAEGSVPGDVLYPIKRLSEAVVSVVDADRPAQHRVDEVEALLDRDDLPEVPAALDRADREVERHGGEELRTRLEQLRARARSAVVIDPRVLLDRDVDPALDDDRRDSSAPDGDADEGSDDPRDGGTDDTGGPDDQPDKEATPTTSPTPNASGDPTASDPSMGSDADQTRLERHEAGRAGIVILEVGDRGLRLHEVRAGDGWLWRASREHEPTRVIVGFTDGNVDVVLVAEWVDGQVHVSVTERERPKDRDDRAAASPRA